MGNAMTRELEIAAGATALVGWTIAIPCLLPFIWPVIPFAVANALIAAARPPRPCDEGAQIIPFRPHHRTPDAR
jgi:hypothetical protein